MIQEPQQRREELREIGRANLDALVEIILGLEQQVLDLQNQLNANSRNSSKPPSRDKQSDKPKRRRKKRNSGKKSGGQPGHEGKTLQKVENPDERVDVTMDSAPSGNPLSEDDIVDWDIRQVFELPEPRLIVTEYRAAIYINPSTGERVFTDFPEDASAAACYGPRAKAMMAYLRIRHHMSLVRVADYFEETYGVRPSEDTIEHAVKQMCDHLEQFEEELKEILSRCPVLHADESGANVAGVTHWLHVLASGLWVLFLAHRKRGSEAMNDAGVLPKYRGVLIHDCWRSYWVAAALALHGLCGAHLCRELFALEEQGEEWAKNLEDLLYEAAKEKSQSDDGFLSQQRQNYYLDMFRQYRDQGRLKHPPPVRDPKKKGRQKQTKAQNLLDRLEEREEEWTRFIVQPEVPFTNNDAERPIRPLKLHMKMSGGFRTFEGMKRFARLRSFIACCGNHGLNILDSLSQAFLGQVEDLPTFFRS